MKRGIPGRQRQKCDQGRRNGRSLSTRSRAPTNQQDAVVVVDKRNVDTVEDQAKCGKGRSVGNLQPKNCRTA